MTSPRALRPARVVLAVGATALGCTLYARLELPWTLLGPVALVPFLAALDRAERTQQALALGLAQSAAFVAAVFSWFPGVLARYTGLPLWACAAVVLALSPVLEPEFAVAAVARFVLRARGRERLAPLGFALVYVGTEWAAPKLLGDTLGHGLYPSVILRQAADLAGVRGLTLGLLIANELVLSIWRTAGARSEGWQRRLARPALGLAAMLALGFGYGALREHQVRSGLQPGPTVGVVQADITQYAKLAAEAGTYGAVRTILDTHYALSDQLVRPSPPDLLLWPETVYPTTFGEPLSDDGAELDREIERYVQERKVTLLFGAYDRDGAGQYNAAVLLRPGESSHATYRKTRLFPLTEWVPPWLDSPAFRRLFPWTGTWKRGPGPRTVALPLSSGGQLRIAPLICYESLDAGYVAEAARQGAELLATLSNDAWFMGTPAPRLHLAIAAFRSVETRLPQVRATNSGISAVIDPTGEVVAQTPVDARAVLSARLTRPERLRTAVVAWGDWLGPLALALGAALILLAWRSR